MRTSFDEVCAASLQRHYTVRDLVLSGLKKSRPQSGQAESELQSLLDEVTTKMKGWLLRQTEELRRPRSAEYFAECWDYLLWDIDKGKFNVDEKFPFDFPQYNDSFASPAAPEHLRILEPQTSRDSAEQIVTRPSISPALVPPPLSGNATQKTPVHGISIVRPIREDLPQALQDRVLPLKAITAVQMAWATLFLWVNLVNDGYNINVVKWARWHIHNEIGMMRERLLDMNNIMAEAIDYVEKEGTHCDPLAATSHAPAPRASHPKLSQHQAKISAKRKAENEKLSDMMEAAAQTQRAEVVARVADIIEGTHRDPAGTAIDWEVLETKLSQFVVETGDANSRATWVYKGCTAWRKENLLESTEQQALFDRELNSWYSGFLDFLGSKK